MKEYLKLIGFFSGFKDDELDEVSSIAEVISARDMEMIIRENEHPKGLYFIVNGEFDVVKSMGGNKYKRLQRLDRGDFFGEMSILNDETHSASVVCRKKGTLLFISKEAFGEMSESDTRFSLKIMKELASILAQRLRHMNLKYGMSVAQLESK
ncbi:MAG: cyclic nucleotide-binding domain-containing protein [Spirochaetes bacterium]|nr:MAG: cyclic nucleotide-binding domain-containing protein [Spirochaetota bacterium]